MIRTLMFKPITNWEDVRNRRAKPIAGPIAPVALTPDGRGSVLESLYDTIGCQLIEMVTLDATTSMRLIVDEEGCFDALAIPNRRFLIAHGVNAVTRGHHHTIVKAAVLIGITKEGDFRTPTLHEALRAYDLALDRAPDTLPRSALADRWCAWLEGGESWL